MTSAPGSKGWLPYCPYYAVAGDILSQRWAALILRVLVAGAARFGEISSAIPNMTDRLLSQRLKDLEAAGLVERALGDGRPARVQYQLTEKGIELGAVLLELNRWALKWVDPEEVEWPTSVD
ncbi:transcriptional regulator [Mycobacterium ahvazicum]|uniref:Transcriptional regulator n=1 Tax=Mycobacterium ahvazicum TaxID=1964395 RepID=A0A2K4Y4W7_9MYCO|nr:helix-turn-helix domain-containing protein [Mycobacterium ahvazicum]SOX51835.1 transcriptional regulator [Mycobacterium ahvazicum]